MDDNNYGLDGAPDNYGGDNYGAPMNEPIDNYDAPMDTPMQQPVGPIEPQMQQPMQPQMQQPVNPYARPTRPMRGYGQMGSYGRSMQPQMQQGYDQMQQPMMQGYNQMPYEQPVDPYGPSMTGMRPANAGGNSSFSSRLKFVIIMVVVAAVVFIGLFFLPTFLSGNSGGGGSNNKIITFNTVKSYCDKNNLTIDESVDTEGSDDIKDVVSCLGDDRQVGFIVFNKPALETDMMAGYEKNSDSIMKIEDSENYKELYALGYGVHMYVIINKNDLLMIQTLNKEDIKEILTDLRGEDPRNSKYMETKEEETPDYSEEELQRSQRDTMRCNDMSRVDVSLVQYQTNHSNLSNNLPGPGAWKGTKDFLGDNQCNENDTACTFVRDYMNSGSSSGENNFLDPDGTPYSLVITNNWAIDGELTDNLKTSFGSYYSELWLVQGNYTIHGDDPLKKHIVYIVPGAKCSDEDSTILMSEKRHFAILYYLEEPEVYCIDDQ